ncbi:hypothetical protein D7V94_00130 [Parablautia intestinalis]|uniref:Uncharacterized protein n=1 Tax=Parablautia intestinalis TaxID=2320100 RepID=A0A3A9AR66_9FIRM|nr:hypothetical protein D7V94_00130 [Parablautia intestinalis]
MDALCSNVIKLSARASRGRGGKSKSFLKKDTLITIIKGAPPADMRRRVLITESNCKDGKIWIFY